ncbi:hypothetical protein HELRODRAFT_71226 [Helobdella robusta]|uniref:Sulfotransferase domain-containing protein n=1 Tax=Helobdella robusta TaxID=6412 RepID=T1G0I0_HELRO|nr:hypothetical protein HELRODRAFT_71226 [Helobdella robusta]ESN90501.1 hypothetical protein HELRODRAFT_71226 [Helobdella robusta]
MCWAGNGATLAVPNDKERDHRISLLVNITGLSAGDGFKNADGNRSSNNKKYINTIYSTDNNNFNNSINNKNIPNNSFNNSINNSIINNNNTETLTSKLPQVIIAGVKKGGTKALLSFLDLHPHVRAFRFESHFFDKHFNKGLEWYRLVYQMPLTSSSELTIEKTPSYFVTPGVPRRIREGIPNVKIILVFKDPITRLVSDYTQTMSKYPNIRSFYYHAFLRSKRERNKRSWKALDIGIYHKHLQRWLEVFDRSDMYFMSGETLITDPAYELQKVEKFLNLKPFIKREHFVFNAKKGFLCPVINATDITTTRMKCLGDSKGRSHPQIHPISLFRISSFYHPLNLIFYQMTGINFNWTEPSNYLQHSTASKLILQN